MLPRAEVSGAYLQHRSALPDTHSLSTYEWHLRTLGGVNDDAEELLRTFGGRVRSARTSTGLSQESMAHRCGVHRTYYSAVERGERNVSLLNLLKIARGLAVDPAHLVGGLV